MLQDAAKVAEYNNRRNWKDPETSTDRLESFLKGHVERKTLDILLRHKWAAQALYEHLTLKHNITVAWVYKSVSDPRVADPIDEARLIATATNHAPWAMLIGSGPNGPIHICLVDSYSNEELKREIQEKDWSLVKKGDLYEFKKPAIFEQLGNTM